jgi:RNase P protein component
MRNNPRGSTNNFISIASSAETGAAEKGIRLAVVATKATCRKRVLRSTVAQSADAVNAGLRLVLIVWKENTDPMERMRRSCGARERFMIP